MTGERQDPPLAGSLAVYLEVAYRRDDGGYSADRAFVQFVLAWKASVERLALIGRARAGRSAYPIPEDVRVLELPDYPTLKHLGAVLRALPRTLAALDRAVRASDRVVAIGPHPSSLPVALLTLLRRRPLALMVRQDYPTYIRHRLPSGRWLPAVGLAHALDGCFRLLARRVPTVVVGAELARRYRRSRRLLDLTVSLVPERVVGTHAGGPPDGPVQLLSVGRLDPEKAPHLLLEMFALLERRHGAGRFALTIVGTGELEQTLREQAAALASPVAFAGYVAHGDALFRLYRDSDVLVHTALTEGVPQVLIEAGAVGVPIVATDVGGVRNAVADGTAAVLVPPGDATALADAVDALLGDEGLRRAAVEAGLRTSGRLTLERQVGELVRFLRDAWD